MKRVGINVASMSREDRAAYHRKWRASNPEYRQRAGNKRLAKIASETPEETLARKTKERSYYIANKERIAIREKTRRDREPEKTREKNKRNAKRYREKNLDRVREMAREVAKKNYAKNKPRIKAHNKLRRARERGAEKYEVIFLHVLAQRDRWTCHLCGGDVSTEDWSMDHLVPVSQGGYHLYENVKLAHRLCNIRRGTKPLFVQTLSTSGT